MSSSYSQIHNFDQPLYTPNTELIQTALSYKQQKLDLNREKLQNLRDQFGALDVAKDQDKEYLESRLQQVTDLTNQYANMDLSDEGLSRSLQANLSQVIDDNVKNAVLSTKLRKAELAEWSKMEKEKPDLYADQNFRWASQKANKWMTDETVGTLYKGGGGFIAYSDVGKKILENVDKMQKSAYFKGKRTVDQGGYFDALIETEQVDRSKMDEAFEFLLNDQDRRQIQIDAWDKFDSAPADVVAEEYEQYRTTKVESYDEQIANLKVSLSSATGDDKIELLETLEKYTTEKSKLESAKVEDLMKEGGAQAVYTTNYYNNFKDGFLDAYSYAPRVVDIKVDEVSKANLEFGEKVRHNLATEELARAKTVSAASAKANGVNGEGFESPMFLTPKEAIESPEHVIGSGLALAQKEETEAVKGLQKLGVGVSPGDYRNLQILFNKELSSKIESKGIITVNGVKVDLSRDENVQALLRFKNHVLDDNAYRKEAREKLNTGVYKTMTKLINASESGDYDPTEFPDFNWEYRKNAKTGKPEKVLISAGTSAIAPMTSILQQAGFKTEGGKASSSGHNYAHLLRLANKNGYENLTTEQKLTLKSYVSIHLMGDNDSKLSVPEKRELYKGMRDDMMSQGVSFSDFNNSFGQFDNIQKALDHQISRTPTSVLDSKFFQDKIVTLTGGKDFVTIGVRSDINKLREMYRELESLEGDEKVQQKKDIQKLERDIKNSTSMVSAKSTFGTDYYLSELSTGDLDYYRYKTNKETGKRELTDTEVNVNKNITDILSTVSQSLQVEDQALKSKGDLLSTQDLSFTPGTANYDKLNSFIQGQGQSLAGYKGAIVVKPIPDGQALSAEVNVTIFKKNSDGEIESITQPYKREDLARNTGVALEDIKRTDYSAKFGVNAPKIDLGSGSEFGTKSNDAVWANLNSLEAQADASGNTDVLSNIVNNYNQGIYKFKMEILNDGETYQRVIYEGDKVIGKYPVDAEEMSYDDVSNIYKQSTLFASETMVRYIQEQLNKPKILTAPSILNQ